MKDVLRFTENTENSCPCTWALKIEFCGHILLQSTFKCNRLETPINLWPVSIKRLLFHLDFFILPPSRTMLNDTEGIKDQSAWTQTLEFYFTIFTAYSNLFSQTFNSEKKKIPPKKHPKWLLLLG